MRLPIILGLLVFCVARSGAAAELSDPSCFALALPAELGAEGIDDIKLLIGWVFDTAASGQTPSPGATIDRNSTLADVPGFAGTTDLTTLAGQYRVLHGPFDAGHGYYGIELGRLDAGGRVTGIVLANRLFRLPVVLHEPIGVLTDIVTNGAMVSGLQTLAIRDAEAAADVALAEAERQQVPLIVAGQSQAGGEAQLQAAYLAATHPERTVETGFVTLNAASVIASIRGLHLAPEAVAGVNFVKDLDPGFGPHGLLPNRAGLQVFIHPDGTAGAEAGDQSFFAAARHPAQHLLGSFNDIPLGEALAATLAALPDRCVLPS